MTLEPRSGSRLRQFVCWLDLMRDEARLGYFEVMAKELPRFTENFVRLLGLHRLSQHSTAELLGVSPATMRLG